MNQLPTPYTPLLLNKDLSIETIQKSNLKDLEKKIIINSLNYPKISSVDLSYSKTTDSLTNSSESFKYKGTPFFTEIAQCLVKMFYDSGIKYSEKEQEVLILNFIAEIKDRFYYLTLEEVKTAINMGVRKDFGEYYGINIVTLNEWIKSYQNKIKKPVLKNIPILIGSEILEKSNNASIVTDEKKFNSKKEWLLHFVIPEYKHYLKTGEYTFFDLGNQFYNYCEKNKIILPFSDEIKKSIYKIVVFEENNKQPNKTAKISDLVNERMNQTTGNKTENSFKKLSVKKIFDTCKEQKIDLEKLILDALKLEFPSYSIT